MALKAASWSRPLNSPELNRRLFQSGLAEKDLAQSRQLPDNRFDVQAVFRGKLVVALVVPGTAITAPVPYSINTKFAAQREFLRPLMGEPL